MQINIRLLKAAAFAISKDAMRYYLNGVCLQADEKNGVILIATDGHRLLAFRDSETWEGEPINVIIPSDVIASIKLNKYYDEGELTQDGDKWSLEYAGAPGITFKMIDGTFPDWRRVVPNEFSGEQATFNPKYYGDFAKVAKSSPSFIRLIRSTQADSFFTKICCACAVAFLLVIVFFPLLLNSIFRNNSR